MSASCNPGVRSMALKKLLVHVGDDNRCQARLVAACGLARRSDAAITGLYVRPFPVVIPAAPIGGAMPVIDGLAKAYEQAGKEAHELFEAITVREGVRAAWNEDDGDAAERIAAHARYADLAVVGQWSPDDLPDRLPRDMGALVAMSVGRPTLMLPYAGEHDLTFSRVLLCWNGRREAVRAAHDMMTLLPAGARVDIACVDPEGAADRNPGADIGGLLAAHDLKVEAHRIASGDVSVADALLAASSDFGSDLIVMGAYGHARLREIAFGGATRDMLLHAPVPLLLSH